MARRPQGLAVVVDHLQTAQQEQVDQVAAATQAIQ
jgi:hypothetical protein